MVSLALLTRHRYTLAVLPLLTIWSTDIVRPRLLAEVTVFDTTVCAAGDRLCAGGDWLCAGGDWLCAGGDRLCAGGDWPLPRPVACGTAGADEPAWISRVMPRTPNTRKMGTMRKMTVMGTRIDLLGVQAEPAPAALPAWKPVLSDGRAPCGCSRTITAARSPAAAGSRINRARIRPSHSAATAFSTRRSLTCRARATVAFAPSRSAAKRSAE